MPLQRSLLLLSLLAACGDSGSGPETDTDTTDPTVATTGDAASTGTTTGDAASTSEEPTGSSTGDTDAASSSSSTGEPPGETDTDTDGVDTDTTGEPVGPCDGLIAPDPANTYLDNAFLSNGNPGTKTLVLGASDENDNSWEVGFYDLKPEDVAPGELVMYPILFTEAVGPSEGGAEGTATLEFVEVTPDCITGRVSEVVLDPEYEPLWIDVQLPGGFVAVRFDNE